VAVGGHICGLGSTKDGRVPAALHSAGCQECNAAGTRPSLGSTYGEGGGGLVSPTMQIKHCTTNHIIKFECLNLDDRNCVCFMVSFAHIQ